MLLSPLTTACDSASESAGAQAAALPSVNAAGKPLSKLVLLQVESLRGRAVELRASGHDEEAERVENQAARVLNRATAMGKPLEASRSRHHGAAKLRQLKKLKRDMGDAVQHPELPAEMKLHGWRMARLLRIKNLLEENPNRERRAELSIQVRSLLARELDRHRSQVKRLAASHPE